MEHSRSALQKLEDLGPQFSAQVQKIRKALYQLTLDYPRLPPTPLLGDIQGNGRQCALFINLGTLADLVTGIVT